MIDWLTDICADQSLDDDEQGRQPRLVRATLKDIYDVSLSSPEWKKALKTSGLALPQAEVAFSSFASDVRSVFRTQADSDCIPAISAELVRFGFASTEGAMSFFRISPRGNASYMDVLSGVQIWVIAVPREPSTFSSIRVWSSHNLDLRSVDTQKFRLELVYMRPGDRL